MRNLFLIISFFICLKLSAQKKVSFGIDAGILKSVGKNISAIHQSTTNPTLSYVYYSREKYPKTYFSLLAFIQYSLSHSFTVGVESGIYYHLEENYYSNIEENTISIPVRMIIRKKIIDILSNPLGIQLSGGPLYFDISNKYARLNNGMTYNTSIIYKIKEKRWISVGIEKEIDNTTFYFYPPTPDLHYEFYEFKLKRLSLAISFQYLFGSH